jgi:predicted nuclease of predicted toxin-antitoxin system
MKIFVDENIPRITIDELTKRGYNVFDIRGTPKEGTDDDVIWEIARKEGRLIITTDKGFSKNISLPHFGIIIVKLKKPNHLRIHEATLRGLDK